MDTGITNFLLVTSAAEVAGQAWAASAALRARYADNREAYVQDAMRAARAGTLDARIGQADQPALYSMLQTTQVRA